MIADWTSFDDFLYIYSDIVGIFNNPDSLQTAKDFITKANIRSIEEVNRAFYVALEDMIENHNEALSSVINDDGSINTDTVLGKIL
jgi:guanylate kinase